MMTPEQEAEVKKKLWYLRQHLRIVKMWCQRFPVPSQFEKAILNVEETLEEIAERVPRSGNRTLPRVRHSPRIRHLDHPDDLRSPGCPEEPRWITRGGQHIRPPRETTFGDLLQ